MGIAYGPRKAFTEDEVREIRSMLKECGAGCLRDLAVFNTGIDTMLHASDLLSLKVKQVMMPNGTMLGRIKVTMGSNGVVVECVLSSETQEILKDWIAQVGKGRDSYLFTGRSRKDCPITLRQLGRLVKQWAEMIGLDPTDYGTESLRRTRALYIAKKTGDFEAIRVLLGFRKIISAIKYFGDVPENDPMEVSSNCII